MEIEGKIWREENVWLVEIPSLDAMTQGKSRKNALRMTQDLIEEMMGAYFGNAVTKKFKIFVADEKEHIVITANDTKLLLALSLRRFEKLLESGFEAVVATDVCLAGTTSPMMNDGMDVHTLGKAPIVNVRQFDNA